MGKRNGIRTITSLAVTLFVGLCAASCGSSGNGSTFNDAGGPDYLGDATTGKGDGGGGTGILMQGNPDATTGTTMCTPKTCADLGATCGQNGDGCGGLTANCGTCTSPQFCGGGGPSQCGYGFSADGGLISGDGGSTSACTPVTCASQGFNCGQQGDGCGALIAGGCGTCPAGQSCGGPNAPGQCVPSTQPTLADGAVATLPDGAPPPAQCIPLTCAGLGANCGQTGDGCGNALDCSVGNPPCTSPQFCGGAGANKCGGNNGMNADGGPTVPPCVPTTCAAQGFNCGKTGDGCGGTLDCSVGNPACVSPQYCGGGGANKCGGNNGMTADGASSCVPTPCGANECGVKADGCGGLATCPVTCTAPDTCGGSAVAYQCGHCPPGSLCAQQPTCTSPATTTLTGTVRAGVSAFATAQPQDPVPNVLVYIPSDPTGTLQPITTGYTANECPSCSADVSGNVLVSTYTDFDGTFTLSNVPVGSNIPVVIQMGRWRKEVLVNITNQCAANSAGTINLPRNHSDGLYANIPLTAISTGNVDAMECILLKMGIDQAEFTANNATNPGRIHIYAGGKNSYVTAPGGGGQGVGPGSYIADTNGNNLSQPELSLMGAGGTYMNYDQIMFPCWGAAVPFTNTKAASNNERSPEEPGNLLTYANSGGHFFATHFSYAWLVNNGLFNNVASWNPNADNPGAVTWDMNVSTTQPVNAPHTGTFAKWLNLVGALITSKPDAGVPPNPQVAIVNPRYDANSVANGSLDWIDGKDQSTGKTGISGNNLVEHFTFDTTQAEADGGTQTCGHEIFSDFHVTSIGTSTNNNVLAFPTECTTAALTSQERILEYMIWDLGACAQPPTPVCNKLSCSDQNITCGEAGDGCGGTIPSCGTCPSGELCTGGACVPTGCTPLTACPANIHCGQWGDGCGSLINCGPCTLPETCGGGGVNGTCGAPPDGGACVPQACPPNIMCGPYGDGCGGLVPGGCGTCPPGETCGGAGINGVCGSPPADGGACVPQGCPANIQCGPWGDGCGGLVPGGCGTCPAGQTCGGGGVNGMCGGGMCTPLTCSGLGYNCGMTGDGCGSTLDCGTCPTGQTCGGGGVANVCGAPKTPK